MAALRQTGSHCGGPRAGQVLPETQIPPKQSPSCLPVTGRGILRALPGKGLGLGHKGSIFPGKELAASSCLRSPYISPTATTVMLGLAASGPHCCATLGTAGHWPGYPCKLQAGCGLSSSRITRRSSAGPEFAFKVLHKRRPGWQPWDKVCPWAELCQGAAQLGTGHSQRGGSLLEPSPGCGLRTWPWLVLTRFADVPSRPALCTSLSVPTSAWAPFPQSFHG